ncbi:hypothetical protein LCGC14_0615280 [marine sediment metagenome]|uniref:Uncharacterized protein n=1 Tax=marine sediment metagenome TaxID=412755 RepID=A0A0F9UEX8_9ZZZZ|nr:hypothetical protein [Pricia sp.]HEC64635.1 hypothetical protein [bacterium]
MSKLKNGLKIPKVVPIDWSPSDWNDVIYVVTQAVKGKKIKFEKEDKPMGGVEAIKDDIRKEISNE